MKVNRNYDNLKESYLFYTISEKVKEFRQKNPDADIIRLGIGDVTLPLPPVCVEAMKKACDEMGTASGFRGYGPYEGYDFLRNAIAGHYKSFGVDIDPCEIYVSDGAKSDIGNILDIFSKDNTVLVTDPVYPVYVDTNIMDGRKVVLAPSGMENGFLPLPDESVDADIIYLCSPNNPTGAVYDREGLKKWVDYAIDRDAVILFDAAYEAFISSPELPHSIFEIEGSEKCAIEFCSFSKTAGFTGTRCGYCVIPDALERVGVPLGSMWLRRQSTKYNGTPYIIQRGAEAAYSPEGRRQTAEMISYYMNNARTLAAAFDSLGIYYTGGINSPYIWFRCPHGMKSWEFFDYLLEKAHVVGTPGVGFGSCGEGFFRMTAFGTAESTAEAAERMKLLVSK